MLEQRKPGNEREKHINIYFTVNRLLFIVRTCYSDHTAACVCFHYCIDCNSDNRIDSSVGRSEYYYHNSVSGSDEEEPDDADQSNSLGSLPMG